MGNKFWAIDNIKYLKIDANLNITFIHFILCALPVYVYGCPMCTWCLWSSKEGIDSFELDLGMVVTHHGGTGH